MLTYSPLVIHPYPLPVRPSMLNLLQRLVQPLFKPVQPLIKRRPLHRDYSDDTAHSRTESVIYTR